MNSPTSKSPVCLSHSDEEVTLASSHPKRRTGRKKFKETRHPVYRGVRQRNSNKWVCELREPSEQKRIWLGTYPTAEMAARAHDVAALALRGPTTCLNFADSLSRLPVPTSKDAKEVRRVAMEAAEAFRPRDEVEDQHRMNVVVEIQSDTYFDRNGENFVSEFDLSYYMAGGALMSPPPSLDESFGCDVVESDAEVDLWSYSI